MAVRRRIRALALLGVITFAACEDTHEKPRPTCGMGGVCTTCWDNADCDDEDPCTIDVCGFDQTCQHGEGGDEDDDGHVATACGGDDCDDQDWRVPIWNLTEWCNGLDDDCDGTVDDDCQ